MAKISYNLPSEFQKPVYLFDLHLLLKEYEHLLDEYLNITINVEIRISNDNLQYVNVFDLNDNMAVLTIPFKRILLDNKLTDLPNPYEFFATIRFALETVVRDNKN